MLADSARGFLDKSAPVKAFRDLRDAGQTHDAKMWKEMAAMGWAGVLVPESAGGVDMGHAAAGILAQEMGKTLAVSPFLSTAVIAATALRHVSDARAEAALDEVPPTHETFKRYRLEAMVADAPSARYQMALW